MTGGGDGGSRVKYVMIFIRSSDKNGQDQEVRHQGDSTGGTVWIENTIGKTWVGWTCTDETVWVYWENNVDDGVASKEERGKGVYGCGEIGHG